MAYPFDDETYNGMPFGPPAPFGFGGGILSMPRASAVRELGRVSSPLRQSITGGGGDRSAPAEPTWQIASSDDPSYPYYPRPGYAPPLPDIFAPWRKYAVPAHEDLWRFLFMEGPHVGSRGPRSEEECDNLYDNTDSPICRDVAKEFGNERGQRCWASAMERYSACKEGKQIPPLDWGGHD